MASSFSRGATMIVRRPHKAGGRDLQPADHFDWKRMPGVTERRVGQMMETGLITELSSESYAAALQQRTDGKTVGRGFTEDGLKAMGIIGVEPPSTGQDEDDQVKIEFKGQRVDHRDRYILDQTKVGNFTRFDVYALEGGRLNPGGTLNGLRQVDSFIDQLEETQLREAQKRQEAQEQAGGQQTPPATGNDPSLSDGQQPPVEGEQTSDAGETTIDKADSEKLGEQASTDSQTSDTADGQEGSADGVHVQSGADHTGQ